MFSPTEVNLKELECIKDEAGNKNDKINQFESDIQVIKGKIEQCNADLVPLREQYEKIREIGERLSSITASKTKVETE